MLLLLLKIFECLDYCCSRSKMIIDLVFRLLLTHLFHAQTDIYPHTYNNLFLSSSCTFHTLNAQQKANFMVEMLSLLLRFFSFKYQFAFLSNHFLAFNQQNFVQHQNLGFFESTVVFMDSYYFLKSHQMNYYHFFVFSEVCFLFVA